MVDNCLKTSPLLFSNSFFNFVSSSRETCISCLGVLIIFIVIIVNYINLIIFMDRSGRVVVRAHSLMCLPISPANLASDFSVQKPVPVGQRGPLGPRSRTDRSSVVAPQCSHRARSFVGSTDSDSQCSGIR